MGLLRSLGLGLVVQIFGFGWIWWVCSCVCGAEVGWLGFLRRYVSRGCCDTHFRRLFAEILAGDWFVYVQDARFRQICWILALRARCGF